MPANATINGDGFRVYAWPGGDSELHRRFHATEEARVLSVTSIRNLCGTPFQLVNWQITNVVNVATGQRKAEWRDYSKSKRGRLVKGYRKDGPFPGEFVTRMIGTRGGEDPISEVRSWLKMSAEEPRDVAAVRGSVVHKMIELNIPQAKVDETIIRWYFDRQWEDERRQVTPDVTDQDVAFVKDALDNYFEMRLKVPFVILSRESQIWNLSAGYAGSADVLMWFLGEWGYAGTDENAEDVWEFTPLEGFDPATQDGRVNLGAMQALADAGQVTIETVHDIGGYVALGDWKTSPDVYTGHVVQGTAYLGGEFVGADGVIDERLTMLLKGALHGLIIKIRPDGAEVDFFDFDENTFMAFLGSCVFARFLAFNKKPDKLFTARLRIAAPDVEPEKDEDAA